MEVTTSSTNVQLSLVNKLHHLLTREGKDQPLNEKKYYIAVKSQERVESHNNVKINAILVVLIYLFPLLKKSCILQPSVSFHPLNYRVFIGSGIQPIHCTSFQIFTYCQKPSVKINSIKFLSTYVKHFDQKVCAGLADSPFCRTVIMKRERFKLRACSQSIKVVSRQIEILVNFRGSLFRSLFVSMCHTLHLLEMGYY